MPKLRKYVLTLKDQRSPAPADEEQVAKCEGRIVDRVGRTVKVEAPESSLEDLGKKLPSWHVQPELTYEVPDTRRFVKEPPDARKR